MVLKKGQARTFKIMERAPSALFSDGSYSYRFIDFMEEKNFLHSPENLGASFTNEYLGIDGNFILLSSDINMTQLSFKVVFKGDDHFDPYYYYYNFIDFLKNNNGNLYLQYKNTATWVPYERNFVFNSITKTEINEFNVLEETLTLDCSSLWFAWASSGEINNSELSGESGSKIFKELNYEYIYNYPYHYGNLKQQQFSNFCEIYNRYSNYLGELKSSPVEIRISVPLNGTPYKNPFWRVLVNGAEIQNDRFLLDLTPGNTLIVSGDPVEQRAVIETYQGNVINVGQYQDLTCSNFVRCPYGTSIFQFPDIPANCRAEIGVKVEALVI